MKIMYEGKTQSREEGCVVSHPGAEYVCKISIIAGEEGFFWTASLCVDSVAQHSKVDLENSG
jgi:hypothetical protein